MIEAKFGSACSVDLKREVNKCPFVLGITSAPRYSICDYVGTPTHYSMDIKSENSKPPYIRGPGTSL